MNQTSERVLSKVPIYIFYLLLAYMPLHILLSTFIGTTFGILPFAKVAKDIILIGGFLTVIAASMRQEWFKDFLRHKLVLVIIAYAALTALLALIHPIDTDAEILGVVYNIRFLIFFLYGWMLIHLFPQKEVQNRAIQIVLIVGVIVAAFGIFQYVALPDDALTKIGYSRENGVLPAFFIDDKPDLERAMSTVRDPNSFGSYTIILAITAIALATNYKQRRYAILVVISLLALFFSYSRSAWLGMLLAWMVLAAILGGRKIKSLIIQKFKYVAISVAILFGLSLLVLYQFQESYFVQNVVFHADQSTVAEDPNELRLRFWRESVQDVAENPLGTGPGTAGLASIRNDKQGTELNENYYLQIANEVGIIGLALFVAILLLTAILLFKQVSMYNPVATALFASFIGLALTNFLVHIWANEAVAYTWWGLAGIWIIQGRTIKAD